MSSRRGAVKVNPVTGKMEKVEATAVPAGKHRDGSLLVDDRYVNAAKDLGLGSEKGMYGHLKALAGMGAGAADVPVGSSMGGGGAGGGGGAAAPRPAGWGAGRLAGEAAARPAASAIADAVASGVRTGAKGVGAGNVHGFASKTAAAPSVHAHADSFQRAKGVVNTVGGAKDINRLERAEAPKLPGKGEAKGAQIMGFSTLDAHSAEGKARREAAAKREAAGGNAHKMNLVHVSGGGDRMRNANIGRLGADVTHAVSGASARAGGLMPTLGTAPTRDAPKAARIVGVEKLEGASGVLGGSNAGNADAARAARAAHFDKMFAERNAVKAAAVERLGMGGTAL